MCEAYLFLMEVTYEAIETGDKRIGVIAQELKEVFPELVREDSDGYLSVSYGSITGVLIEAIKEQQKQIDEQKAQINELKLLIAR